jgi:glycosyltransferase involved in cell wall biosynthesis
LEESKINQIRAQFNQGKPYLVFVGAQLPRKNIPRLLQALDAIWSENPQAPNLLLVGEPMWSGTELNSVVKTMKNPTKLNFTGRLQRPQVAEVIGAADGLLLPSLFEGFGIPVLEAMACGVPVLTSNSTSLPEVAADAAVLVNPTDVQHIKQGIEQLLYNQELRQQCIEKGLNRSAQFSWEQSAEALFKNLERIFPDKTSTHSHD